MLGRLTFMDGMGGAILNARMLAREGKMGPSERARLSAALRGIR